MLHPITGGKTCAQAWVAATKYLVSAGDEVYNMVVDINDPSTHTPSDQAIIVGIDNFLREHHAYPVSTVANTIFPQALYRLHGSKSFIPEYLKAYDALKKKQWGRYFERMVRWQTEDGRRIDQLGEMVKTMSQQLARGRTFKNIYEMTLFDPGRDKFRERNRQCLSFLSFKLHPDRGLMLTAIYRNHHYISRAIGNFIGLGNLMAYIANEVGTTVGPLTCVSTHAEIDTASAQPQPNSINVACKGWTLTEARGLIKRLTIENSANTQTQVMT